MSVVGDGVRAVRNRDGLRSIEVVGSAARVNVMFLETQNDNWKRNETGHNVFTN
jgi:hypothetical protein